MESRFGFFSWLSCDLGNLPTFAEAEVANRLRALTRAFAKVLVSEGWELRMPKCRRIQRNICKSFKSYLHMIWYHPIETTILKWMAIRFQVYMGVEPKIGGKPPKWMVKIMENPYEQMDDLGGKKAYFWKHLHIST